MKVFLISFLSTFLLSACSGLSIVPISVERASKAHGEIQDIKGYIVYQPKIFVNVGPKEDVPCGIVSVNYLPDYSRPYMVSIDKGFGGSSVSLEIQDGWMLSKATANVDNTAMFNKIWDAFGLKDSESMSMANGNKCAAGVYLFDRLDGGSPKFTKVLDFSKEKEDK